MENEMEAQAVNLADAIDTLRHELAEAINRGTSANLPFSVSEIDLELAVVMKLEGEVGTKVSFKVLGSGLEVGGKGGGGQEQVHRVRLTLRPRDGGSWDVSRPVPVPPK